MTVRHNELPLFAGMPQLEVVVEVLVNRPFAGEGRLHCYRINRPMQDGPCDILRFQHRDWNVGPTIIDGLPSKTMRALFRALTNPSFTTVESIVIGLDYIVLKVEPVTPNKPVKLKRRDIRRAWLKELEQIFGQKAQVRYVKVVQIGGNEMWEYCA